jgi:SUMO ligase MMS21 Smc5/6 complex component
MICRSAAYKLIFYVSEDGDDSDDDDELEMGGVTQSYTCPITLTPLVAPMTS